jgi:hypothetical protein
MMKKALRRPGLFAEEAFSILCGFEGSSPCVHTDTAGFPKSPKIVASVVKRFGPLGH